MPIAKVRLPDGRVARFNVPEGTTPEEVTAFAAQQNIGAEPAAPTAAQQQIAPAQTAAQPQATLTARQDAARILGLDPNIVERGTILPFGVTQQGDVEFAVPEIALDVARAALTRGP